MVCSDGVKILCVVLFMSKSQGLFIEKHLLGKLNSRRESDHVLLHVSGEHVLELKICFVRICNLLGQKNKNNHISLLLGK